MNGGNLYKKSNKLQPTYEELKLCHNVCKNCHDLFLPLTIILIIVAFLVTVLFILLSVGLYYIYCRRFL
jgi:hypothetical protein